MVKNKVFTIKSQLISLPILSVAILLSVASSHVHAETGYVSDQLKVALRSGASNGHRIIKFLRSGTALTIIGTDGDYSEVQTIGGDNKGWILSQDIMSVPSARDRLVSVNAQLAKSKEEIKKLKSSLAEAKKEVKQLKNEKGELQNERTNLSNSLDDLKITAANPVALSKKNKQLKKELEKARANEAMLDKDNQQLRSNVMQEWFVIGGAVSIGSLILGLIITRINWRRKRDSWGDSF